MARGLRWVVPIAVAVMGLAVTVVGFAYDLAFAGLPYQDPTPEMQARWRYHSGVASAIELSGAGILLLGVVALVVVALWSLAAKARRTQL
jgi:hypothetical protein